MQRLLILFLLCFSLPIAAQAGSPSPLSPPTPPALSNLRFTTPLDIAGGEKALKIEFDTAAPVDAKLELLPGSELQLTLNGVSAAKLPKQLRLDGKLASNLTITQKTMNSVILNVKLQQRITPADYRLISDDPQGNKPGQVSLTITKPLAPLPLSFTPGLKDKLIFLDPGHGGSDPGAIGPAKTREKDVTLAVARKVKALLEKAGAKVVLTRETDKDVFAVNASGADELGARAATANRSAKSAVFISIHADSFSDRNVGGSSAFYFAKSNYDQMLAQNLQRSVAAAGGLQDRGTQSANFFVLKRTRIPAALLELGFISNPAEEKFLTTPSVQDKFAQGIVGGLYNFFAQAAKIKN